jgi:hypothetical protein
MSNIIKFKPRPQTAWEVNHKDGQVTTQHDRVSDLVDPSTDGERIVKIRNSLDRINALMADLRQMASRGHDDD